VVLLRRCPIVFVESTTRVKRLSLSGRLCRPFAARFYVQWPGVQRSSASLLRLLPSVRPDPDVGQVGRRAMCGRHARWS
jgi:hypothetical protein